MKTLLTGKPYVKADRTDISKTFRRIRKEMKQSHDKQLEKIFRLPTIGKRQA